MKQFVMTLKVPLPDDAFAQAEILTQIKAVVDKLSNTISEEMTSDMGDSTAFELSHEIIAKRLETKPRAKRGSKSADASAAGAAANGSSSESSPPNPGDGERAEGGRRRGSTAAA